MSVPDEVALTGYYKHVRATLRVLKHTASISPYSLKGGHLTRDEEERILRFAVTVLRKHYNVVGLPSRVASLRIGSPPLFIVSIEPLGKGVSTMIPETTLRSLMREAGFETIDSSNSGADFQEMSVQSMRRAIEDAYAAGVAAAKAKRRR